LSTCLPSELTGSLSDPETDFTGNQREAGAFQMKATNHKPLFKVRSVVEWICFSSSIKVMEGKVKKIDFRDIKYAPFHFLFEQVA
jgi:hypothetical protein